MYITHACLYARMLACLCFPVLTAPPHRAATAVSRAIGDKDFKENNVVSALPDVICRELCDADKGDKELEKENVEEPDSTVKVKVEEDYFKEDEPFFFSADEMNYLFVVLACDGVWDTLSNKVRPNGFPGG